MRYSSKKIVQSLTKILIHHGINKIIVSPGSRNAPLILDFKAHPKIKLYSIVDERCAAFVALGMIKKTQNPVAVCCTSGSALLNYYPAISEAFYQNKPLIVLSADRPKNKIDQSFGQTIRQENVFKNHIGFSANLIEDESPNGLRYNERLIHGAIHTAIQKQIPVHINIPFSEPLYNLEERNTSSSKIIQQGKFEKIPDSHQLRDFANHWNTSGKKMILVGEMQKSEDFQEQMNHFLEDESVVVLCETTSNIAHVKAINNIDQAVFSLSDESFEKMKPEVLLTLSRNIISKKIKSLLEKHPPRYHANISPDGLLIDTFSSLTHHFETSVELFLSQFSHWVKKNHSSKYQQTWLRIKQEKKKKHEVFLKHCPYSDLKVFELIINRLPQNIDLHLGNSSIVRYAQLFEVHPSIEHYSNRGTSGIEGSTSTAMGSAMVSQRQTVVITGDISFFYDSNALWNHYTPKNFVIILLNNGGGEIFKFISDFDKTEVPENYFVTPHSLTAQHLTKMFDYHYFKANNIVNLSEQLSIIFSQNAPTILEIDTQKTNNAEILKDYFEALK